MHNFLLSANFHAVLGNHRAPVVYLVNEHMLIFLNESGKQVSLKFIFNLQPKWSESTKHGALNSSHVPPIWQLDELHEFVLFLQNGLICSLTILQVTLKALSLNTTI